MIKKALPMLFLQTTMINLLLTKFSGPKHHALALTGPIFVGFCVCHTYLSGGGGAVAKAAFPPPLATPTPPLFLFAESISQDRGQICLHICGFPAHRP